MAIQLIVELSEQSLIELLSQLLPATVDLDPLNADGGRRWIRIAEAHHVDFVPDVGLRVRTSAALQWTALGIDVPVTLRDVELMFRPVVTNDERGPKLVFQPSIEKADFKLMPAFVDAAITTRLNTALAAEGDLLGWHFGETLTQQIPMPPNLSPVSAMGLAAGALEVKVHEHGLIMKLGLNLSFSRQRKELS